MSFNIYETVGGELNFYFRSVLRPNDGVSRKTGKLSSGE